MKHTILYIHGLGGSQESRTGKIIQEQFVEDDVLRPDIPLDPKEAKKLIDKIVRENHVDVVVGSSLGGFYAMGIPDVQKVVVNPAMFPFEDLINSEALINSPKPEMLDENGKPKYFAEKFLKDLYQLEREFYDSNLNWSIKHETVGIFGNDDSGFFDHYNDFKKIYEGCSVKRISAKHSLSDEEILEHVIPMIKYALKSGNNPGQNHYYEAYQLALLMDSDFSTDYRFQYNKSKLATGERENELEKSIKSLARQILDSDWEFISISKIQREMGIGFNRAGRIFSYLKENNYIEQVSKEKGYRIKR